MLCALFILFGVLGTVISSENSSEPIKLTLKNENAFLELAPVLWNLKDGDEINIDFRFRTHSVKGRILTLLISKTADETELLAISASVFSSAVIVGVEDGKKNILKSTEPLMPGASDGKEHTMIIRFNQTSQYLSIGFGEGKNEYHVENIATVNGSTDSGINRTVVVVVGKHGVAEAVIGCIEIESLQLGGRLLENFSEIKREGAIDGCEKKCANNICNQGKCIDFFDDQMVCDCRGTLKTGPNCTEDIKPLKISRAEYIKYQISDRESQPVVIAVDFKTVENGGGVLIQGEVFSVADDTRIGEFVLSLIDGSALLLRIGSLSKSHNVNITPERFYNVILQFDYAMGQVNVMLDDETPWSLDGIDRSIKFGKELVFGKKFVSDADQTEGPDEAGISACLRQIYVGHFDVIDGYKRNHAKVSASGVLQTCETNDATSKAPFTQTVGEQERITEQQPTFASESCENNEATFCKNSVKCVKQGNKAKCICRKGFIGNYCQFSALPRNCDDVFMSGNTQPGNYYIDVDGSGPLPETVVFCENGKTTVPHNMPDGTYVIRSKEVGSAIFRINYRFLNEEALLALRKGSEECSQTVSYECRSAPIGFSTGKTSLTTLGSKELKEISTGEKCFCKGENCTSCNCDKGGNAVDSGIIKGENVPLTSITAYYEATDGTGRITLGPFACSGSAGRTKDYTATFRSPSNPLAIGAWKGASLSFEFKIYEEPVTLISSNDGKLEIMLKEKYVSMIIDGTDGINVVNITLDLKSRLNNGSWHKVQVEVVEEMVRFSVNESANFFSTREIPLPQTTLSIGGGVHGFSGCIRHLIVDGNLKSMAELLKEYDGRADLGCKTNCAMQNCQHGSRCVEDFENDIARCICRNSITQSGDRCEKSINTDTEISLHHSKKAFLRIDASSVENALTERIAFSVRTDQRKALLLFMFDHLNNFVQIHLSYRDRIVLILNNNNKIHRCEVASKGSHGFSQMQWIQIMLFQEASYTQLNVDGEFCEIPGGRALSGEILTTFDGDWSDVVTPLAPAKAHSENFVFLYVGGVSTKIDHRDITIPQFESPIPNLLGCIRGLMLGPKTIDMRDNTHWHFNGTNGAIKDSCDTGCEDVEKTCKNDGYCTYDWTGTARSAGPATCECSETSYYGTQCDQDTAMLFTGESVLEFSTKDVFNKDRTVFVENTMNFAFAAEVDSERPQRLASVHFEDDRVMDIVLCKNGSVNVWISSQETRYVHTFPSNYSDGYRHFFQSTFIPVKNRPLTVTLDSLKFEFLSPVAEGLSLINATEYHFGGSLNYSKQFDVVPEKNFSGCISNIDINLYQEDYHFKPILYKNGNDESMNGRKYSQYAKMSGNSSIMKSCSSFKIPEILPAPQDIVAVPEWVPPDFAPERLSTSTIITPTVATEMPSGSSCWWIVIVIVVLLILIIVITVLIYWWSKKASKDKQPPRTPENDPGITSGGNLPQPQPENIPLLETNQETTSPVTSNYEVPEANQPLSRPTINPPNQPKEASEGVMALRAAPLAHTNETNRLSTPPYS